MSRLTRRIPSIVFAVLFVLVSIEAQASSYLFRLTEQEIDDVMTHYYPKGYDRDAVLRQMAEPFDCGNFGDLCREVGEDYAYRMLEGAWSQARMRYPIAVIDRTMEHQIEDYGLRWFERLYPDDVPDSDPYWGETRSAASCTDTASATSGDFRIVQTSRRYNYALGATGRVKVEHFKKNVWGNWNLSKADRLEVEGTVFVKFPGWSPFVFDVSDVEYDKKNAAASHTDFGVPGVSVPYVEGCGGTSQISVLYVCTCSGTEPAIP